MAEEQSPSEISPQSDPNPIAEALSPQTNDAADGPAPPNRRGRVKGMGIFQIVLGSLCGLMTLILVPITLMQQTMMKNMNMQQNNTAVSMIFSIGAYALLSASFLFVGIGAVRLRRWVPKVVLAINWPFFIIGIAATFLMIWLMPIIMEISMAGTGAAASQAKGIITGITTVVTIFVGAVYIVIPGLHVLLFRGEAVQHACDLADPKPRWTDDLPLAVVGLTIWTGVSAVSWLGMGAAGYGAMFGYVPTGFSAMIIGCAAAAVSGVLTVKIPKRTPAVWWALVAFFAFMFSGGFSTFLQMDLAEFYRRTGMMSEFQLRQMQPFLGHITAVTRVSVGVIGVAALAFFIYAKRYFRRA